MEPSQVKSLASELEALVERFEEQLFSCGDRDFTKFLPAAEHPLFDAVLREFVRVDMEFGWDRGQVLRVADYQQRFPDFFQNGSNLQAIAFEEYRLRRQFGESPTPEQYEKEYGIATTDWPRSAPSAPVAGDAELDGSPATVLMNEAAQAYRKNRGANTAPGSAQESGKFWDSAPEEITFNFFQDLHARSPKLADDVAESLTSLPEVGDRFLDFYLAAELGRGAFGRVFLALQAALANRLVALKIAPNVGGESQTLAQMQHTHIVPVYSIHKAGALQAVCMPFLGRHTLADVTRSLRKRGALPNSGIGLFTTMGAHQTQLPGNSRRTPGQADLTEAAPPVDDAARMAVRKKLESWSYVEAVLWVGSCLADGLAHAHERGIIHRDLKPANVLITDEGQPMLLDFNLAEDLKLRSTATGAVIGGTLPYMAPEQIDAFRGSNKDVDGRSDVYSLGLILFELLTGTTPWAHLPNLSQEKPSGTAKLKLGDTVEKTYQDRYKPPASVRQYNRLASPAVALIIRHCLEADPRRRYQDARHLQEDLQRQLEAQPLKYAREASPAERVRKRLRRSPRLLPRLAMVAAVLLFGVALWFGMHLNRLQQHQQAQETFTQFRAGLPEIQFNLNIRDDHKRLALGRAKCWETLELFGAAADPDWRTRPTFTWLEPEQQQRVEKDVGDLLLLLVLADLRLKKPAQAKLSKEEFEAALRHNQEAEKCLAVNGPSPAVLSQRADLYERQEDKANAQKLRDQANQLPAAAAQDLYFFARQLINHNQVKKALPLMQKAAATDPQNYWAYFLLGSCYDDLGNDREAAASYTVCIALEPKFFGSYFNRGLAYLRENNYNLAGADFTKVIDLRPDFADAYFNRSLVWNGQKEYRKALDDLVKARSLGADSRVFFVQARVKKRMGDLPGHQKDFAEGMKHSPTDELGWVVRGQAQMDTDFKAALADFDQALALNPISRSAWKNKAVVYTNSKEYEKAIACLDKVIQHYPDHAPAWGGRGVLFARLGQRDAALKDAQAVLLIDRRPPMLYQAGCIYALTSKEHPADRAQALKLITDALRQGYGVDYLATDSDLDPLRPLGEFKLLLQVAKTLKAGV